MRPLEAILDSLDCYLYFFPPVPDSALRRVLDHNESWIVANFENFRHYWCHFQFQSQMSVPLRLLSSANDCLNPGSRLFLQTSATGTCGVRRFCDLYSVIAFFSSSWTERKWDASRYYIDYYVAQNHSNLAFCYFLWSSLVRCPLPGSNWRLLWG